MEPNQMNPVNNSPIQPSSPINATGSIPASGHKKIGPIIVTLVVVLILVIAGLYLFASKLNNAPTPENIPANTAVNTEVISDQTPSVPTITNSSDNPIDLQADLEASTEGLDEQNF